MDADHEQIVVADAGHHAAALGAGVHRHMLPDRVVTPDHERRFLTAIFEVLRFEPDRRERKDAGPLSDHRTTVDDDMSNEPDARSEHHILANHAIGPDRNVVGQSRPRRDDRGGVDLRHHPA